MEKKKQQDLLKGIMAGKNKHKLLFLYKRKNSFVAQDISILEKDFDLKELAFFPFSSPLQIIQNFIKQFVFLLFSGWKYKRIYIWFADYHAFLPSLFSRINGGKTYVVNGGYDVNISNEFNYGALKNPFRAKMVKYVLNSASYCIPVTRELEPSIRSVSKNTNIITIPTGYDPDDWHFSTKKREYFATTVSITSDKERFLVKGIDRFVQLATLFPNERFLVVGTSLDFLASLIELPINLEILPPVTPKELNTIYQNSKFYAQFSRSEGLPNAICEAMLCGCIPVATDVGGISNLVSGNGILLNEWNEVKAAEEMRKLNITVLSREKCREFISSNYSLEKRKNQLFALLKN